MISKESQVGKKKKKKVKTHTPDGDKYCQGCGSTVGLEVHHVYGASSRDESSRHNCVEWLCHTCHRGKNGVHGQNKALDTMLKQKHQLRLEKSGMTRQEFRYLFGKGYL